jgi:hypothetical protein
MSGSNKEDEAPAGMKRNLSSKSCLKKLGNENAGEARSIPPSLAMSKSVSFHKIEIGQYPIELGDNPCATGPPIQIGWKPESKAVFPLEGSRLFLVVGKSGNREESARQSKKHESNVEKD